MKKIINECDFIGEHHVTNMFEVDIKDSSVTACIGFTNPDDVTAFLTHCRRDRTREQGRPGTAPEVGDIVQKPPILHPTRGLDLSLYAAGSKLSLMQARADALKMIDQIRPLFPGEDILASPFTSSQGADWFTFCISQAKHAVELMRIPVPNRFFYESTYGLRYSNTNYFRNSKLITGQKQTKLNEWRRRENFTVQYGANCPAKKQKLSFREQLGAAPPLATRRVQPLPPSRRSASGPKP